MNETRREQLLPQALRVAVIGCGSIGRTVLQKLPQLFPERVSLVGLLVRRPPVLGAGQSLPSSCVVVASVSELLGTAPDLVVECASHEVVRHAGPAVLFSGSDLMIVSTGALADETLHDALVQAASRGGSHLRLVSGAIGSLDVLGALRRGGLPEVRYTGTKPPAAWSGSAAERCIDLTRLAEPVAFFQGNAREAAAAYPKNANVAATVAMAGAGFERTKVTLVADPRCTANQHHIEAVGTCGSVSFEIRAAPSSNARSSAIVGDSVCNAVGSLVDPLVLQ